MENQTKPGLYWTPRVLGLGFAAFLAVFAFDVFREGAGFWTTAGALLLHLVPALVVLGATLLAWRRPTLGAVLFVGLGALYVVLVWGRFPWVTYLAISGPLVLTGILFALDGMRLKRLPVK